MMFKEALANSSRSVTKLVLEGRLSNARKFLEQTHLQATSIRMRLLDENFKSSIPTAEKHTWRKMLGIPQVNS